MNGNIFTLLRERKPPILQYLFTGWFISAIVGLASMRNIKLPADAAKVNLLSACLIVAVTAILLFVVDWLIPRCRIGDIAMAASVLLYAAMLVWRLPARNNFLFYCAVLVACLVCGIYLWGRAEKAKIGIPRVGKAVSVTVISVIALCSFAFVASVTVLRYLTYSSPNFDFGIFCNMFHYMKETGLPTVSCERDQILSHFAVHISPIYYIILPFYMLFSSPITLQIAQAVAVVSGVIPLLLIAKKRGLGSIYQILIAAVYCFYPAVYCGCFYDIHENCFLLPLLLWLLWALDGNRTLLAVLFTVLTLCVKEDAAIYVAVVGIYAFLSEKKRALGGAIFLFAIAWFAIDLHLLATYGEGAMTWRYKNFCTVSDTSLTAMLLNILRNPALVLSESFEAQKMTFLFEMLIPLGVVLPFATKKVSRYILLIPFLLVNLMTDYVYQFDIGFQYVFGSAALLLYLTVINLSELTERAKLALASFAALAGTLFFLSTVSEKSYYYTNYSANRETYDTLSRALADIPEDASVQSSTFLLPHIADRREIYQIWSENETEYIVLDLRYGRKDYDEKLPGLLERGYEVVTDIPNVIMILRLPSD